jgi:predicted ATPase
MKLGEAVNYWLERFAVASSVTTREIGRPGIEVSLSDAQTRASRDLTGVGVGVSQLLPVVVLCLLAEPGEMILLEQPELHLHPAPQQILGDFLLNVATSGRQLLVETHSEYLINRLRLRVVDDQFGDISDLMHIWYATRSEGRTTFELLKPNRFGAFDEWPAGFFDQAPKEAEAILRAAARKRRAT